MELAHRKIRKQIQLKDEKGAPIADKEIRFRQTNHSFLFGCGAFDFIPYVMNGEEEYRQLTESWLEVFNYGTLPSFGLPIHFTENTLISGEIMPAHIEDLNDWQVEEWPSTSEGEERQAKEIEEMYRVLFAHPLVEAITTWDYRDGAWLNAPSGFIRKDNSLKPSYRMLKKLIREEWMTDVTVKTDSNGCVSFEGFKGDYTLSTDGLSAQASFTDDGLLSVRLQKS